LAHHRARILEAMRTQARIHNGAPTRYIAPQ
jgi:hypothetical protein